MGWSGMRFAAAVLRTAGSLVCLAVATGPAGSARGQAEALPPPPGAARASSDPAALEPRVGAADRLLREARFEQALAATDAIRRELAALGDGAEARRLAVRNEVVAATAHVALDREAAARECFRRALGAQPALDLDPAATPPKVLRVFLAVRAEPRETR